MAEHDRVRRLGDAKAVRVKATLKRDDATVPAEHTTFSISWSTVAHAYTVPQPEHWTTENRLC
jgi:hypothetical protein